MAVVGTAAVAEPPGLADGAVDFSAAGVVVGLRPVPAVGDLREHGADRFVAGFKPVGQVFQDGGAGLFYFFHRFVSEGEQECPRSSVVIGGG